MSAVSTGIVIANNSAHLQGELTFATVPGLYQTSLSQIGQCQTLRFDFSQVTHCDSAALALLIEWKKYALETNKNFIFTALPKQLVTIATLAGLTEILMLN